MTASRDTPWPPVTVRAPWAVRVEDSETEPRAVILTAPAVEEFTLVAVREPPLAWRLTARPTRATGAEIAPPLTIERLPDPACVFVTAAPRVTPCDPKSVTPLVPVIVAEAPVAKVPPLALSVTARALTAPERVTPVDPVTSSWPPVRLETAPPRLMACAAVRVMPLGPVRAPAGDVEIPPVVAVRFNVEAVTAAVVDMPPPASRVSPPVPVPLTAALTKTSR